jgi:hypothetical protein
LPFALSKLCLPTTLPDDGVEEADLRSRLRRAVLYPLSYGGSGNGDDPTGVLGAR